MDREELRTLLLDQSKRKLKEDTIQRELLSALQKQAKTSFIIIISGIRRSGKSTLLNQIRQKTDGYYVNFDDERLIQFNISHFQMMYELLIELFGEKNTFFFDEIQNIKGWERFVRRLHDEGKKIYITGSNASMLSKELGTHLTGRHLTFSLFPFSFKEFLIFNKYPIPSLKKMTTKERSLLKQKFNEYINQGGFPEFLKTQEKNYLSTLYENIIYRDIITRYKLSSERAIKETVYFSASNIGKEISFNSLRKMTKLTSATTIREYFEYLENSYLTFLISRFNFSLKKQIYANKKIYFIDPGMAQQIGFRFSQDIGRIFENIVFLELKRRNNELFFHKDQKECDFLIRKGNKITEALQVTHNLKNSKEREIQGLLEAMNNYKLKSGKILTMDEEGEIKEQKKFIKIIPIWKWLLK